MSAMVVQLSQQHFRVLQLQSFQHFIELCCVKISRKKHLLKPLGH